MENVVSVTENAVRKPQYVGKSHLYSKGQQTTTSRPNLALCLFL